MKYRETKQPQIPVNHCAWCGSYDLGIGWQQNEAIVTFRRNGFLGNRLKYMIYRNYDVLAVALIHKRLHKIRYLRNNILTAEY